MSYITGATAIFSVAWHKQFLYKSLSQLSSESIAYLLLQHIVECSLHWVHAKSVKAEQKNKTIKPTFWTEFFDDFSKTDFGVLE